ncbi:MAG: AgmX/PglI C-terminal domain-containing protein [Myxococcales bacterium]|nr:AgmX/PglI C-terminal domain-containing protein [Myxococcales bacterium]
MLQRLGGLGLAMLIAANVAADANSPIAFNMVVVDGQADAALVVAAGGDQSIVRAALWTQYWRAKGVPATLVRTLAGREAIHSKIITELNQLTAAKGANGRLWLVVMGPGQRAGQSWHIGAAAESASQGPDLVAILAHATQATAGNVVAVLDVPTADAPPPLVCTGPCVLVASVAEPSAAAKYHLSMQALIALAGRADRDRDGTITVAELDADLRAAPVALHGSALSSPTDPRGLLVVARNHRPPAAPPPPPANGHPKKSAESKEESRSTGSQQPPGGGGAKLKAGRERTAGKDEANPFGGLGLSGTGKGGGGSGEGTIGLGNLDTSGRGGGSGSGSGYGSGLGRAKAKPAPIERFPTLEAPDKAQVNQAFGLQVSLTEAKIVQDVKVQQGQATAEGKLQLQLDTTAGPWTIDVALAAPGFEVVGSNLAKLELARQGDSTPALFQLRPRPALAGRQPEVFVTFWLKGRFLAKVSKPIAVDGPTVASGAQPAAPVPASAQAAPVVASAGGKPVAVQGVAATLSASDPVADLTVWLLQGTDPSRPDELQILVQSPHLQPSAALERAPTDLGVRLDAQYTRFARRLVRGADAIGVQVEKPEQTSEETRLLLRGFGKELYANATPLLFKQAFATLQQQLGDKFGAIQIYTNSPRLPWELLIAPKPGGGDTDFLGVQYRIARWHISSATQVLSRPPPQLEVSGVYVVAPSYTAVKALPAQDRELKGIALASRERFRKIAGDFAAVKALVAGEQSTAIGVVHFAGHGLASTQSSAAQPEFSIRLADRELPLLAWKGLPGAWGGAHPLVFFNACEVGRAERTAGFVDGWGPAVLEKGASGYIGGLWPLGDSAAADAASVFYAAALATEGASVAEALRQVRAKFEQTGDPTYMAYVYYGDANLTLRRRQVSPSGGVAVALQPLQVMGSLASEIVQRVIMRNIIPLRYCAEKEAQSGAAVSGRIVVQIAIGPEGKVVAATLKASTVAAKGAQACMVERFRRMQFPKPENGMVMVSVPLLIGP